MKKMESFLLLDPLAVKLYDAVKDLPVIDWHNHLSVKDLAEDRQFALRGILAQRWLHP